MKRIILSLVLIVSFLMLGLVNFANATTYYVDFTDGLETNDGLSPATAWKLLGGKASVLSLTDIYI